MTHKSSLVWIFITLVLLITILLLGHSFIKLVRNQEALDNEIQKVRYKNESIEVYNQMYYKSLSVMTSAQMSYIPDNLICKYVEVRDDCLNVREFLHKKSLILIIPPYSCKECISEVFTTLDSVNTNFHEKIIILTEVFDLPSKDLFKESFNLNQNCRIYHLVTKTFYDSFENKIVFLLTNESLKIESCFPYDKGSSKLLYNYLLKLQL